jgi:hypothetical protein
VSLPPARYLLSPARQARRKSFHGFVPLMKKLSALIVKELVPLVPPSIQDATNPEGKAELGTLIFRTAWPVARFSTRSEMSLPTVENRRREEAVSWIGCWAWQWKASSRWGGVSQGWSEVVRIPTNPKLEARKPKSEGTAFAHSEQPSGQSYPRGGSGARSHVDRARF